MVRTFIFASAVLALIATVSAIPTPDPLISAKADRHIGTGPITAKDSLNRLVSLDRLHAHDVAQDVDVIGGKKRKRDETEGAPVRISKAIGVKGSKKMAKPKGAKGAVPKK